MNLRQRSQVPQRGYPTGSLASGVTVQPLGPSTPATIRTQGNSYLSTVTPWASNLFRRSNYGPSMSNSPFGFPSFPAMNRFTSPFRSPFQRRSNAMNMPHTGLKKAYNDPFDDQSLSPQEFHLRLVFTVILLFLGFMLYAFSHSVAGFLTGLIVWFISLLTIISGLYVGSKTVYQKFVQWWNPDKDPYNLDMFDYNGKKSSAISGTKTTLTERGGQDSQSGAKDNSGRDLSRRFDSKRQEPVFIGASGAGKARSSPNKNLKSAENKEEMLDRIAKVRKHPHTMGNFQSNLPVPTTHLGDKRGWFDRPKDDMNDSPQRAKALNPNKIVDQQSLNKFVQRTVSSAGGTSIGSPRPFGTQTGFELERLPSGASQPTMSHVSGVTGRGFSAVSPKTMTTAMPRMSTMPTSNSIQDTPISKLLKEKAFTPVPSHTPTIDKFGGAMYNQRQQQATPMNLDPVRDQNMYGQQSMGAQYGSYGVDNASMIVEPGTSMMKTGHDPRNQYDYSDFYAGIDHKSGSPYRFNNPPNRQIQRPKNFMTTVPETGFRTSNANAPRMGAPVSQQQLPASPFSRQREIREKQNAKARGVTQKLLGFDVTSHGESYGKWNVHYADEAARLYRDLDIVAHIHNWAESSKWFLMNIVAKERYIAWNNTNKAIHQLVEKLKEWYPNMRRGFDQLQTLNAKSAFLVDNEKQMVQVAKDKRSPQIVELVQKRKHLQEGMKRICKSNTAYVIDRLKTFVEKSDLSDYRWNKGGFYQNQEWNPSYPCDAQLLMKLFVQYMDDILCPATLFHKKHFMKISLSKMNKLDQLRNNFKDIAIVAVTKIQDKNESIGVNLETSKLASLENVSLPYYFLVFDNAIIESKESQKGQEKENMRALTFGGHHHGSQTSSGKKIKVGAWYPQPGDRNLFHCVTLFALFIHRYLDNQLSGMNLAQGQTIFLKHVLAS